MLDSFDRLPRGFTGAKPIRHIDLTLAMQRDRRGDWIIQRKRDGERAYLVIGTKPRFFSRGLEDLSAHVPHLIPQVASLRLPYGTIIDGELVAGRVDDDIHAVSALCRSSVTRAATLGVALSFAAFDVLSLNRIQAWSLPYKQRYYALIRALPRLDVPYPKTPHLWHEPDLEMPLQACREKAHDEHWEGLVLWDKASTTSVKFGANVRAPDRLGCYKMKDHQNAEFVATGYTPGAGSAIGQVGALRIAQYIKDGHRLVLQSCGTVGTGLSLTERADAVRWTYPLAVEVRYDSQDEIGGLRCPSFVRLRPELEPEDCIRESV